MNMLKLEVSNPYIMTPGRTRIEVDRLDRLKLTGLFLDALRDEIKKMEDKPEYKLFLFICAMKKLGIKEGTVIFDEENNVYKLFEIGKLVIYINPYKNEISVNNMNIIKSDAEIYKKYKQMIEVYEKVFGE